ncbi:uracil DNA glycosylase [Emmonsiellopsis sp. PD_33]|nr:uracil DNA glycosylase [Emmonsiellopsis sp. PD_33]
MDKSSCRPIPFYTSLPRVLKKNAPESTARLPIRSTWTAALKASSESLDTDRELVVFPPRTKEEHKGLKELARLNTGLLPPQPQPVSQSRRPIRTSLVNDNNNLPRASPAEREAIRKMARELAALPHRQPYVLGIPAATSEGFLPTVSGTVLLRGIDAEDDSPNALTLDLSDMPWDTGSHGCTITSDLLSPTFSTYLESSEHDPYRSASGVSVQAECSIVLTNALFQFSTVFTVVPRSTVPNNRSGVILGQNGFLDRIVCVSKPRAIFEYHGEKVGRDVWGDICVVEYIGTAGLLKQF